MPGSGPARGLFVTFEGLDDTGKSTQARRLAAYLRRMGLPVVHTREPGGTPAGRRLRSVVLGRAGEELVPMAELLALAADRAQHVARVVRPALERGCVVVCERYADSTVAYQAFGLGVERRLVEQVNALATGGLVPDLTFLLDRPEDRALGRPQAPGDRIEGRGQEFFRRVRQGYLALAAEEPRRIVVLQAVGPSRAELHRQVVAAFMERLGERLAALVARGPGRGAG